MGALDIFRRTRDVQQGRAEVVHEQRDPSAATQPLRWTTPGRAQPPDWNAAQAFERAYYSNVVVYACFQAIASTISSLPFRVGADPDKPTDYDTTNPLARLLGPPPGGPNPGMSAEELWHFAIIQYLATGRFGWEVETDDSGTPAALWPLVSSSLTPIPSTSGVKWFSRFEYGRAGDLRSLPPERVIYCWAARGSDFRQPESALEAAHLDINVAVMQSRYDYAFLKNDARPPAIVVTEEFDSEASFEAFKRQFNSEHRGPDNAGKVAFAEARGGEQGVKGAIAIETLGFSPKDAQAAQRHASAMQHIAMAIGVPWSRLDASGRTFDNASEEDKIWWQQRLIPLIRRLQSAVNIQLAPRLGNLVGWFDLSKIPVLRERPEPLSAKVGAPALVQAQIMTINEARADYGLPPTPDGDRFMTPEEIAALSGSTGPGEVVRMLEQLEQRMTPPVPAPVIEIPAPDPVPPVLETRELTAEEHEVRRSKIWTSSNATVVNLERIWERAWRKMFTRQERSVIARLEAKRGRNAVRDRDVRAIADEVFDVNHWSAETEDESRALYEAVTAAGGARVSNLYGIAFDLDAPYAQEFVHRRANQLAGPVTQTTHDAIKGTLAEGVAAGEGIPALSSRVHTVFDTARGTRATTIARTEVISAYNGSAVTVASQLGSDVVGGQEWIATRDGRTREWHAELDGTIVAIGDVFPGGLAYPGDPGGAPEDVVNCRCTVAFLTPDEMEAQVGGRARMVDRRTAHAVLALVRPGEFDEPSLRAALRDAA